MKSLSRHSYLYLLVFALAITQLLSAQTFRGGIAGTVVDSSGAVVANAKIVLLGTDTGYTRETVSTSAGAYSFQDLPLGLQVGELVIGDDHGEHDGAQLPKRWSSSWWKPRSTRSQNSA